MCWQQLRTMVGRLRQTRGATIEQSRVAATVRLAEVLTDVEATLIEIEK